jgi:hypothetical protein
VQGWLNWLKVLATVLLPPPPLLPLTLLPTLRALMQRGQLGTGNLETRTTPSLIQSLVDASVVVTRASAGGFHSAVLTSTGGMFAPCAPSGSPAAAGPVELRSRQFHSVF